MAGFGVDDTPGAGATDGVLVVVGVLFIWVVGFGVVGTCLVRCA